MTTNPSGSNNNNSVSSSNEPPYPSQAYAWYVVVVLILAYTCSFIDRQILSLLVEPMKRDIGITDTQMSLLQGMSFAIFYTLMGLPLGRLVDVKSRRGVIATGIFFWSLMTAACGLTKQYWQLFLARMGVGVGEAALSPGAYSLIADYFKKERLATAISAYAIGIYVGAGLALIIGGAVVNLVAEKGIQTLPLIGEVYNWQVVFFYVGLPGLLLLPLLFTIKEPIRRGAHTEIVDGKEVPKSIPVKDVVNYIKDNWKTFLLHNVGFGFAAFAAYAHASWAPTFLIRTHGYTAGDAGLFYGSVVLVAGTLGVLFGGLLSDWFAAKGYENAKMKVPFIMMLLAIPSSIGFPLVEDFALLLVFLAITTFLVTAVFGVGPAAIQELMPNNMRGQGSALYLFVANIIGLGLGPTSVAMATDYIFGDPSMLRYSLLFIPVIAMVVAVICFFLCLKPYKRTLEYLIHWQQKQ